MKLWQWVLVAVVFFGICLLFDWVANRPDIPGPVREEAKLGTFPYARLRLVGTKAVGDTMCIHVVHNGRDSVDLRGAKR